MNFTARSPLPCGSGRGLSLNIHSKFVFVVIVGRAAFVLTAARRRDSAFRCETPGRFNVFFEQCCFGATLAFARWADVSQAVLLNHSFALSNPSHRKAVRLDSG